MVALRRAVHGLLYASRSHAEVPFLVLPVREEPQAARRRQERLEAHAERLWQRSVRAGRAALCFFALAVGGPVASAALLLRQGVVPEWHLMFGGFGLAAVPILIGRVMLRHEEKLRDQYREVERELANQERLELALELERMNSEPGSSRAKVAEQVLVQLLSPPPAPAGPAASIPPSSAPGEGKEGDGDSALVKGLEVLANALSKKAP